MARLDDATAQRAADYLRSQLTGHTHLVDFFSLIFAAELIHAATGIESLPADRQWRDRVAEAINNLRRADGGFAKSHEGAASSTYYSFLAVLTLQLIERPIDSPELLAKFLLTQRRDDGGFVEIRPMRRSGTNPTAAAVGLLRILQQLPGSPNYTDAIREEVLDFLCDLQTDEGGFKANTQIPIADLLSTFTAMLTLTDLNAADEFDRADALKFVESLDQPAGGFLAADWDEAVDVEYSFYGIAARGLLS